MFLALSAAAALAIIVGSVAVARGSRGPDYHAKLEATGRYEVYLTREDDTFLPHAHGEAYARLIPGAILRTIPQCGHLVPFEQTEMFMRYVTEFLQEEKGEGMR